MRTFIDTFVTTFVITFVFCILYYLFYEFNTHYELVNSNNILPQINKKHGTLYIGTHNYEHKDIFITLKEFEKSPFQYYMLFADKYWNHLLEPLRPKNIEFLYVKNDTVNMISSKLYLGHNVIMFYYKETDSTGPYYILNNVSCDTILFQIKDINLKRSAKPKQIKNHYNGSFWDILVSNLNRKFTLDYNPVSLHNYLNLSSKEFIMKLKELLYHE